MIRLYDRDIPEIPLAVDRYGPADKPAESALHMALYERPYDKDPAEEARWLDAMARAAGERLGIPQNRIFVKTRRRMRGLAQYERQSADGAVPAYAPGGPAAAGTASLRPAFEMTVREAGLSFIVNLSEYLDTGIFPDHRPARAMIGRASEGLRVLNLFCYTGAFSVHAAAGGAARVTSVDLSNTYLAWARRNFEVNGLQAERHRFERADVMAFLREAARDGLKWDLVVADPPTFSNSSMSESDFDVNRDWPRLLGACARVLSAEGAMLFSTNSRRLKWDERAAGLPCLDVSERSLPPDFRDRRAHRAWILGNHAILADRL